MAILNYDQIYNLAQQVGFNAQGAQTIAAISLAESGGNTGIISSPNTNGTRDYGLVQINSVHFGEISQAQALSPVSALAYALKLSSNGTNFTPWATFNSGAYQKYLQAGTSTTSGTTTASTDTGLAGLGTFFSNTGSMILLFTIAIVLLAVGLYFLVK